MQTILSASSIVDKLFNDAPSTEKNESYINARPIWLRNGDLRSINKAIRAKYIACDSFRTFLVASLKKKKTEHSK